MKNKKMLVIEVITIIIMVIILIPTISKAGVESKPGGTVWTNITISDAYRVSYDMREKTSTLGNNSLDPHLALHKDWGAVAYLALSSYGAVKDNKGPNSTPPVNGGTYTSTTGNPTGVMNFGNKFTYLSGGDETELVNAANKSYRQELIDNQKTRYVETLSTPYTTETTKGMALKETAGWFSAAAQEPISSAPLSIRYRFFGL